MLTISGLAGIAEVVDHRSRELCGHGRRVNIYEYNSIFSIAFSKPLPATKGVKPKDIDGLSVSELVKLIRKAEETTDNSSVRMK